MSDVVQDIKDLDFQYDNGFGIQWLTGTIWMVNGDWIERGEYDGSEWWEYKKCPLIPESFDEIKAVITSTAGDIQTRLPNLSEGSGSIKDPGVQIGPANF